MIFDYTQYQQQRWFGQAAFGALAFGLKTQAQFMSAAGLQGAARYLNASSEMALRLGKDYPDPGFGLAETTIGKEGVAVTEETVQDKAFGRLLHFKRDTSRNDPRVLLVAPLSGHHATLLRDTVKGLLPHHDVYITDWKDARDIPVEKGEFGLADYIAYVQDFIETVGPETHVMAVCQPTVPVLAAASLMAARKSDCQPLSMTLISGPIDIRFAETKVTKMAKDHSFEWFENNVIDRVPASYAGAGRRVYPGFLQLMGFASMNPERHLKSHVDMFNSLAKGDTQAAEATKKFYDDYNAVLDMPAPYYLETIREVFQNASLARNQMVCDGERVDPSKIKNTTLLTVECTEDDISAPGQTFPAHVLCSGLKPERHYHYEQEGAGHYGGFSGRRYREGVLPRITAVIRDTGAKRGIAYDPVPESGTGKPQSIMPEQANPQKIAAMADMMQHAETTTPKRNGFSPRAA